MLEEAPLLYNKEFLAAIVRDIYVDVRIKVTVSSTQ